MTTEEFEMALSESPFFRGMQPRHIHELAIQATSESFPAGEFIFREGEDAQKFYLIREGRVTLEVLAPDRGVSIVQTISAGDVLGWSWLFPPHRWQFDARAVEPARTLTIDARWLRGWIEADHDFGYEMMKRIAHVMVSRLQATRLQLTDVYGA